MNSIFPLPPALELSGKTVDAFHALPPADQKQFRALVLNAIAAHLAADQSAQAADEQARTERRERDAQAKADRHAHFCGYLESLDLSTLAGRVRFFSALNAGVSPLTVDMQTTGYVTGNTDPEKMLIGMKNAKLDRIQVDLALSDSAQRGVWAFIGSPALLDAVAVKHGLPDTVAIENPNGTQTRLFSCGQRCKRPSFNSPELRVVRLLQITPQHSFGTVRTDRAIGHLPALPAKLDGWLRSCENGNEQNFFELLKA